MRALAVILLSLASLAAAWTTPVVRKPASFLAPASVKPLGARVAPQSALQSRCQQQQPQQRQLTVRAAQEGGGEESKLPMLLDVNTRGGLLFVSTIGTGGVFGLYKLVVAAGVDDLQAGACHRACVWVYAPAADGSDV